MTIVTLSFKGRLYLTKQQEEQLADNFELAKAVYNYARGFNLAEYRKRSEPRNVYRQELIEKGLTEKEIEDALDKWTKTEGKKYPISKYDAIYKTFKPHRTSKDYYINLLSKKWVSATVASTVLYFDYKNAIQKFNDNYGMNRDRVIALRKQHPKKIYRYPDAYGFPRKKDSIDSVVYLVSVTSIDYSKNTFLLPNIGIVKVNKKQPLPYINKKSQYMRILKEHNKYYVIITIEMDTQPLNTPKTELLGVDLGLKYLAVLNDGTRIENITKSDKYKKIIAKLKKYQRKKQWLIDHSPKSWDEPNLKKKWQKAKSRQLDKLNQRISKCWFKLNNMKLNYFHEQAEMIVRKNPEGIIVEAFDIHALKEKRKNKPTSANKKRRKSMQETAMGAFRSILAWHAIKHEVPIKYADKHFSSNKQCSKCGQINYDFVDENVKEIFKCPHCGFTMNRRKNTTLNLLQIYDTIPLVDIKNVKSEIA